MQTQCLLNLSDKAVVDKARLFGGNGDSGVRNAEIPSLHPSTRLIPSRKRIALVAHDNQKEKMASWALKHRTRLIEHELYATADCIISSPLFDAEPKAVGESPNQKSAADVAPAWTRITAIRAKKVNLSKTSLY